MPTTKVTSFEARRLLQHIEAPHRPFDQVGLDIPGLFPLSTDGKKWVIVATDYLTRYAETKALPRATASEVAQFFMCHIVLRHGAPSTVITHRGTEFTAQLIEEIFQLSNTGHRKTTAYHPQSNGLTERLNKTITDMISMYINVQHKAWNRILPYVTFVYNTAVQERTLCTPFRLLYGRDVQTMMDARLPCPDAAHLTTDAE